MKKITKKKIIIAAVISVLVCLFVIGENRIRYFYFEVLVSKWYEMMGKYDYGYMVCVHTSQKLTINNGKKEKDIKPIEHFDGMDNCRWEYDGERTGNFYSILVMEGDQLSVTGDEVFSVSCSCYGFPVDYTSCECMNVYFYETRDFHFSVDKERIRFWSDDNLGSQISTGTYPGIENNEYMHINHDFGQEIYALEIRKREDGVPMVYVDLDGDGYCECDCEEYRTKNE